MSEYQAAMKAAVAPLVGAWIEIKLDLILAYQEAASLLSWERGLK